MIGRDAPAPPFVLAPAAPAEPAGVTVTVTVLAFVMVTVAGPHSVPAPLPLASGPPGPFEPPVSDAGETELPAPPAPWAVSVTYDSIGCGTTLMTDVITTGPLLLLLTAGRPLLPVAAPDVPFPPGTGNGAVPLADGA